MPTCWWGRDPLVAVADVLVAVADPLVTPADPLVAPADVLARVQVFGPEGRLARM